MFENLTTNTDFNHTVIFTALVGSQAYGTSTPTSDQDFKGIYIQNADDLLCFKYVPQYHLSKDFEYYEIRRAVELLMVANPTLLELIFSPDDCIAHISPCFEILRKNRNKFLIKKCGDSFGGYAVKQIKKAKGQDKMMNWEKERVERKDPLDFCYVHENGKSFPVQVWLDKLELNGHKAKQEHCGLVKLDHMKDYYALYYDWHGQFDPAASLGYNGIIGEKSNEVRLSSTPKGQKPLTVLFWNRDAYSIHCKEYSRYQTYLNERNEARYVDVKGHNQKIDGKNLLHCRRLLDMAIEIATEGKISVRRPNAEELLKIRRGEMDLQSIIDKAEDDIIKIKELFEKSPLPDEIDSNFCNELILEIRKYKD